MVVAGGGWWRVVAGGGGWWSHLLGAIYFEKTVFYLPGKVLQRAENIKTQLHLLILFYVSYTF